MKSVLVRNRISSICRIAAWPGSILWSFSIVLLGMTDYPFTATQLMWLDVAGNAIVIMYGIALLAMLVSTFTCGTIGKVLKFSAKCSLAVLRGPKIIILTVVFILIWLGAALITFIYLFLAQFLCPAVTIGLCARAKRKEWGIAEKRW